MIDDKSQSPQQQLKSSPRRYYVTQDDAMARWPEAGGIIESMHHLISATAVATAAAATCLIRLSTTVVRLRLPGRSSPENKFRRMSFTCRWVNFAR